MYMCCVENDIITNPFITPQSVFTILDVLYKTILFRLMTDIALTP